MERYEAPVRDAFAGTNGKFEAHRPIKEMAARSTDLAQMGNQAGEGWYLTSEMVDMIEHGCPNIICAQPFACLPNHIVGKGMFRALRTRYPQANIVAVDYDPGASEVNQLNRITLMLSTAVMRRADVPDSKDAARDERDRTTRILWNTDDDDQVEELMASGAGCQVSCPLTELALASVGRSAPGAGGIPDRGERTPLPLVAITRQE